MVKGIISSKQLCFYCCFACLMVSGCSSSASFLRRAPSADNGQESSSTKNSDGATPATPNREDAPEWRKSAWQYFVANGKYRFANAGDFTIPEAAMKDRYARLDLERATKYPFNSGDINHDTLSNDLAVIVVDNTRSDAARFGLVIFNEPTESRTISSPYWLYQNRDLSRTTLSPWSGGLTLRSYREDGTYELCYINWSKQRQAYSCDKEYKTLR